MMTIAVKMRVRQFVKGDVTSSVAALLLLVCQKIAQSASCNIAAEIGGSAVKISGFGRGCAVAMLG